MSRLCRDSAVSPVLATVLLVLIAAATAGALVAYTAGFGIGKTPSAVGFSSRADACHPRLVVTAVSAPVNLEVVRIVPQDPTPPYAIVFAGRVAVDEPWRGKPPGEFLAGGSTVDLWAEMGRTFYFADDSSNALLATIRAPAQPGDATPPAAAPDAPTFVAPAASVSGTASDAGCGGVAAVTARVTDGVDAWDAPATLAAPGKSLTAWTADLSALPLVDGRTYTVTATARDLAGN